MNITVKEHGADCPFNMNGEYMCCNLTDASSPEVGLECDRADPWPDWCPIKQGPVTVSTDPLEDLKPEHATMVSLQDVLYILLAEPMDQRRFKTEACVRALGDKEPCHDQT